MYEERKRKHKVTTQYNIRGEWQIMANVVDQITQLADSMKTKEARDKFAKTDVLFLKEHILSQCKTKGDNVKLTYQIFRCLRNSCIQSTRNQNLILENCILDAFVDVMAILLSPELSLKDSEKDILQKIKVTSIQFLGNFVVQNKATQDAVWNCGFPNLFFNLMSNVGVKEKDFLCMVIYNCMKERSSELYTSDDEYWLLVSVLEYCKNYQEAEWGLFILELVITRSSFISFYKQLVGYLELRSSLVEYISACLSSDKNILVPEEHILFLCEEFSTKSKCIMMLASNVSSDLQELQQESCLLTQILSLLCITTCNVDSYRKVRSSENLLKTLVELLGQKQSLKQENTSSDTGVPGDDNAASSFGPTVGFERDLVRAIGNMCYKNKKIQDKVRELGGIEMLLNACNIDNRNPYIMQWAIFAIHNICEENPQNQDHIRDLEKQGLAPTHQILSEMQIETRLENGRIRICHRNSENTQFRDDVT